MPGISGRVLSPPQAPAGGGEQSRHRGDRSHGWGRERRQGRPVGRHQGLDVVAQKRVVDELFQDVGGELGEQGTIAVAINAHAIAGPKGPLPPAVAEGDHELKTPGPHGVPLFRSLSGKPRAIAMQVAQARRQRDRIPLVGVVSPCIVISRADPSPRG